jgi:hypothetical protein
MRQPDYDDAFDATTLFYDVIAMPAPRECLVFVGPPFLNLLPAFYASRLNGRELATVWSSYHLRDRCCDVWIRDWKGGAARLDTDFGSFELTPQRAEHPIFAGKRVLYTLSKDNDIDWIVDWVRFHARNHGADAVLLYDNGSSRYGGEALEDTLRGTFPGFEIHVVHWPFKYGPQGVSADAGWDSDFCQAGAFQDARFRFLAAASSVLNCDVDELVVASNGRSVFDAAERSPGGYVMFAGHWISNARPVPASGVGPTAALRHGQFVFAERDTPAPCPTKWCVVPRRCAIDDHWTTHAVKGKDTPASHSAAFCYRHFRSISTSWKYQRHWPLAVSRRHHRFDAPLARSFARAGIRYGRTPAGRLWSAVVQHLRDLAHPDLRRS